MEPLDLAYIAGAIDCDGSISISVSENRYKRTDGTAEAQFKLAINFRQDASRGKETVDWVRDILGCGRIYPPPKSNNMYMWETNRATEIRQVCLILKPYLRIKLPECELMLEATTLLLDTPRIQKGPGKPRIPDWVKERIKQISSEMNPSQQKETSRRNKEIRNI